MDGVIRLLNGLLMLAAPLGLGVIIARRTQAPWGLFAAGAVGFVGAQAFHLPFNAWILGPTLSPLGAEPDSGRGSAAVVAMLLGLSAGLFEETARYLVFRLWKKEARSWHEGLMLGAGHGGAEALILGGLAMYGFFQAVAYRELDLAAVVPSEQLAAARVGLTAYWSAPWHEVILGSVERFFVLCIQLSLSIIVLQAFTRGNLLWLGLAIGWHAMVDAAAVMALPRWGVLASEGMVGLLAAASLGMVFVLRPKHGPERIHEGERVSTPARARIREVAIDGEDLERSRYLE